MCDFDDYMLSVRPHGLLAAKKRAFFRCFRTRKKERKRKGKRRKKERKMRAERAQRARAAGALDNGRYPHASRP